TSACYSSVPKSPSTMQSERSARRGQDDFMASTPIPVFMGTHLLEEPGDSKRRAPGKAMVRSSRPSRSLLASVLSMVSALELRRQVQDSGQRGRHLPSRHHALDREAAPLLDQLPVSVVREIE